MANHEDVLLKVLVSELSGDIAEAKSPDYFDPEALGIPILTAASMAKAPLLGTTRKEMKQCLEREQRYVSGPL